MPARLGHPAAPLDGRHRNLHVLLDGVVVAAGDHADVGPRRGGRPTRGVVLEGRLAPREHLAGDREAGLLADCGKTMPFIDTLHVAIEKEQVPRKEKFKQGFLDVYNGAGTYDVERIFERFARLNSAAPGSGLGLAIVLGTVENVGGGIALHTSATGTAIEIWVPLAGTSSHAVAAATLLGSRA